jgi:signal transduction histidine kinase
LSVIKIRTDLALQSPGLPAELTGHLDAIERVVCTAITETRNLAHNLRPPHIDQLGLTDSLQAMIREVSQACPIRFQRRLENVDDLFKGDAATNVYRIVQEALNNLVKHSQAADARITLERDVSVARLRVADDGVGFDRDAIQSRHGLGLTSMTERVRMLGGKLEIHSAPGRGTQLTVELPFTETGAE